MKGELNTYHWHSHQARERNDIPNTPHYQALVFGSRNEWSPPYDRHDDQAGTTSSTPQVDVYVFKTREELNLFVTEASKTSTSFVFFAVPALGKAQVKVTVGVETSEGTGYSDGYDPHEGNRG